VNIAGSRLWPLIGLVSIVCSHTSSALETDVRLKWFSTVSALPVHDVQRQVDKTPSYDHTFDLRSMFRHDVGSLHFIVDHSVVLLSGDATALGRDPNSAVDQTVTSDANRWVDLTWNIEDGRRHQSFHRLDRAAVQWRPGDWSVTLGRQAVSWGSGIVFQPMDLFSPFSPTVVDRDYKSGEDLLLVDRLLPNGHDLQLLHVVRRDNKGHVTGDASSTGFKWHGYAGDVEFEGMLGRHYDEDVVGLSLRLPVGQALLRTDVIATSFESATGDKQWRVSGIVNADMTFMLGERNGYAFAEYFYNDWGVSSLPQNILDLPQALQERLARGEIFNLMREYVALGASIEWHPLVRQTLTVISNLHDGSSLLQMLVGYDPDDHQSLQLGWIEPLGRAGDEFGGVPVLGEGFTSGGASRVYFRWTYFF